MQSKDKCKGAYIYIENDKVRHSRSSCLDPAELTYVRTYIANIYTRIHTHRIFVRVFAMRRIIERGSIAFAVNEFKCIQRARLTLDMATLKYATVPISQSAAKYCR